MMSVTCPLLLCLLSALVEVHSQTVPYVSFMGTNLLNHNYVDLTLVGGAVDGSDSVQCHTDLDTCCSSSQGDDHGDWYASGSQNWLPFPADPGDIYISLVKLSELTCIIGTMVAHLVCIAVLLRPMQSTVMRVCTWRGI